MLTRAEIEELVRRFSQRTVGLVGDLFLDRYLELRVGEQELSIETGLEAYQITRVRNQPGALGTIMCNLASLGVGKMLPLTVIGDDGHGFDLLNEVMLLPVDPGGILRCPTRLTPTYTKPLRDDGRELNRLDVRSREPLSAEMTRQLCQRLVELHRASDGLIVLDQISERDCGVVNAALRGQLADLIQRYPEKPVYIDSREYLADFSHGILKGNESEICRATGHRDSATAVRELSDRTGQPVVCTLGERGVLLGHPAGGQTVVPGFQHAGPIDIVGAGDAATSGLMLALLSGSSLEQAALVGNLVASLTVEQLGTTGTTTPAQLLARFEQWQQRELGNER